MNKIKKLLTIIFVFMIALGSILTFDVNIKAEQSTDVFNIESFDVELNEDETKLIMTLKGEPTQSENTVNNISFSIWAESIGKIKVFQLVQVIPLIQQSLQKTEMSIRQSFH